MKSAARVKGRGKAWKPAGSGRICTAKRARGALRFFGGTLTGLWAGIEKGER